MRLRDFSILLLIAGVFIVLLNLMLTDTEMDDQYGTLAAHSGEEDYSSMINDISTAAEKERQRTDTIQDKLKTEDEINLLTVGKTTITIMKSALSFSYLNSTQNIMFNVAERYGVNPTIFGLLFAIIIIIIIFTIIGAILRWKS